MPSLGLAWNQGQKMAQDLALGKMQTISGIAKAAMEADMTNDYFGDVATAERKLLNQERADVVKNLDILNKKKSRLASGDMNAVAELLTEYGDGNSTWVFDKDASSKEAKPIFVEFGAKGDPTGKVVSYSSPAEAIDTIRATMVAPSSAMLQHFSKRADAEVASRMKMAEKEFDTIMAIREFKNTKDPLERQLLAARLQNLWNMNERDLQMQDLVSSRSTGLGFAGLQNSLDIANLNKSYNSDDLTKLALKAAAAERGITFDKDGIPTKVDGTAVTSADLQAIYQGAMWARNKMAVDYKGIDPVAGLGLALGSREAGLIFNPFGSDAKQYIDSLYEDTMNMARNAGLDIPVAPTTPAPKPILGLMGGDHDALIGTVSGYSPTIYSKR